MSSLIGKFKAEALRLATETLNAGGRIALYDYRDLADPYEPHEHCDFATCTLETFTAALSSIKADGGGDTPESLLSSSFKVMQKLTWRRGATKSLVVLTDAEFLSPDRDGITIHDVTKLSKSIDPVNFYIVTTPENSAYYQTLADDTDGGVFTDFGKLNLVTDQILSRYDSLPRVEESETPVALPELTINSTTESDDKITIKFNSTGDQTLVAMNGYLLGLTTEQEITIQGLDASKSATIALVPIKNGRRGDPVSVDFDFGGRGGIKLKAPNSGQL